MRAGKCILAFLAFCAALVLTGEIYHSYCFNFDEYYYLNFSDIEKGYYERRFELVCNTLEEYGIEVFVTDYVSRGDGEALDIYCNYPVREKLKKEYFRHEGTVCSFFGAPLYVNYHDLSLFTQRETITHEVTRIYCFYDGDIEELAGIPFKSFLPQRESEGVLRVQLLFVEMIWAAAFGLLLFLTMLECRLKKKEWFVRLCNGYPGGLLLAKCIIGELVSLLLPGLLGYALLRPYSAPWFGGAGLFRLAAGFLLLDLGILFASFYLMDHKEAMQSSHSSPGLLRFSYGIRVGVLAMSIMLLGNCAGQFMKLIPVLKAAEFYEQYEGYAHIQFIYQGDFNYNKAKPDAQFLQQCGDRYDAQQWCAFTTLRNLAGEETWMIQANGPARARLEQLLPEYSDMAFEEGRCYVFLPERFAPERLSEEQRQRLIRFTADYVFIGDIATGEFEFLLGERTELIPYRGGIETLAFAPGSWSLFEDAAWFRDPVIIFHAVDNAGMNEIDAGYFYRFAMKITEDELQEIVRSDERIRDYRYTDIYETYQKTAAKCVQTGIALLSIAVLVILLDVLLLRSIVKMEQEMNALEIALKKITGSPFHVRYRNIVRTTISAGTLAVLVTELISWRQTQRLELMSAAVGVGFIALELCFVAVEAFRWERVQVQKILKGGCVS